LRKVEILSLTVVGVLIIPVLFGLRYGWINLVDLSQVYLYTSAAAMIGVLVWGFKLRIERLVSPKPEISKPELTVEYDQLNTKQYSPFVDGHRVLRIRVKNNGDESANKCEARLEAFDYDGNRLLEEQYLRWTKRNVTAMKVPAHDSVFLCVVFSTENGIDGYLAFASTTKSSDFSNPPKLKDGLQVGKSKLRVRIKPSNLNTTLYVLFDLEVKESWKEISMSKTSEYVSSE